MNRFVRGNNGTFILISNGTLGLGLTLVKKFLAMGYNVVTFGSNIYDVESVIKETSEHRKSLFIKSVDITNFNELSVFCAEAKILYGKPSVLINNTSSIDPNLRVGDLSGPEIHNSINANLVGHVSLTSIVIKSIQDTGIVINISPSVEKDALGASLHNASKAGMEAFTLSLYKEYGVRTFLINTQRIFTSEAQTPFLVMYKLLDAHNKELVWSRNRSNSDAVNTIVHLCQHNNSKL